MHPTPLARFAAVVLLSIPAGFGLSYDAHRKLLEITNDPAGYLQHQQLIYRPGTVTNVVVALMCLSALVFLVEGLAYGIIRLTSAFKGARATPPSSSSAAFGG